jgi:hypothetical protein
MVRRRKNSESPTENVSIVVQHVAGAAGDINAKILQTADCAVIGYGPAAAGEVYPLAHSDDGVAGVIDDGAVVAIEQNASAEAENAAVVDQGASVFVVAEDGGGAAVPGYHGDVVGDRDSNVGSAVFDRVSCRRILVGGALRRTVFEASCLGHVSGLAGDRAVASFSVRPVD